jgi:hypothetical protein
MKKQGTTTDAKRAVANDGPDTEKVEKALKASKPAEQFKLGNSNTVKHGFLLAFLEFAKKKGAVDAAMLVGEFAGRQIDGKKITTGRVHRYIGYCKTHGIFVEANGR